MIWTKIFGLWLLFMLVDYAMGMLKPPTFNLVLAAIFVFSDEFDKQAKFRKELLGDDMGKEFLDDLRQRLGSSE